MNIRHTALVAASICLLTTVGCGSRHESGPAVSVGGLPHTLVGEDYNSVMLLDTDTTGSDILGTFDYSEEGGFSMDHRHGKVTGRVHGSRVTLLLDLGGGDTALKGTLHGTTLTVRAPQSDGTLEDYVFKPGTAADYSQRVADHQASLPSVDPSYLLN